jgi:hypothetical protein
MVQWAGGAPGWGWLIFSVLPGGGEQFFAESADLPGATYEVNLEDPVSLARFRVGVAPAVRMFRVRAATCANDRLGQYLEIPNIFSARS